MDLDQKPFLLCLDDEPDNLDALERIFRKKYQVLKATTPEQAFHVLDNYPALSVIISDQRMPLITGVEFLEKSITTHPDTVRILLTGYTDIESVIGAVNKGQIYRYLTKPWDPIDLMNTVDQATEKYLLKNELKQKNLALEKALHELQTLDKAKNQFMILINHELKTPLTTILSFASLLKETLLSDEQKLFTNRIIKSSEKLKSIVEDVLLIVKGEVGLIPKKMDRVRPDQFLKDIPAEITQSLNSKTQTVRMNSDLDTIEVDLLLTRMALFRALHNATKFGLPQTEISIRVGKQSSGAPLISIENKGPHISETVIEKIMRPFMLDENIMNHSIGMGLGLTICQTLMKAQAGSLKVLNIEGGVRVEFVY
ncbi:MAG: hybrid sensor histidine kinase/response regulator [Bdellovibrionales bacterium RIFCSPHIGHO2_01_FULL_40_29]|nr:MAG: hybrid sensor histidine kinase/response regulator [Bdellovibrionales bacterium RIFCSPHIGHO2_01_FULL_40_29]OFZ32815.1 MAG: hybrid sensor histidine kinase/response regulator [Bdellovibrionales bacterium RIFCSPHIGHO2_02_FULL_40_15]